MWISCSNCRHRQTMQKVATDKFQKLYYYYLYINRRLRCDSDMESPYYSKEFGPIVCTVCAQQLGNTRLDRFREDSKHFAQVLPTCSDDCGKWKTSYPRKKGGAKRRAAAGDQSIFIPKVCSNIIWFHSWLMLTLDRQSCQRLKSKPISPMRSLHLTMSTALSRCKAVWRLRHVW